MNTPIQDILKWRRVMQLETSARPTMLPAERLKLHNRLLNEELDELQGAMIERDMTEIADAIGDLIVLAVGVADEFGIPIFEVLDEIYHSNMTKLDDDGNPVFREDGKLTKGPNFVPPDINRILAKYSVSE